MRPLALIFSFFSGTAWAGDCAAPYSIDSLIEDLTAVETQLRAFDDDAASQAAGKLQAGLGCLEEVLPALIAARSYRAVGAGLYTGGNKDAAKKWFRTSLELEPTFVYGLQDIPEGHPLRQDFDQLKNSLEGGDPILVEGREFTDGEHYLDGRKLTKPKARPDRFHIYQVKSGGVASHVIDGNAFPESSLTAAASIDDDKDKGKDDKDKNQISDKKLAKAEAKREKAARKREKASKNKTTVAPDGTVFYKRQRPPEKTPLMIIGGIVMASAGGIYYASSRTLKRMEGIQTAADVNDGLDISQPFQTCGRNQDPSSGCKVDPANEVERLAGATNRLVVASAAVFAVGAGTLTWGVILDGDAAVPTVNVRF